MRKFILILMAVSMSLGMMAQDKLSAQTKVFLQQRANAVAQAPDSKTILASPKTVNGVECVDCFISLNGVSIAELEANGVKVTGKFSDFVTASIPVNKIEAVARMNGVKQVGIARNARLLTDVAKGIVNADKAWDGTNYGLPQGYTGQGVVVGLIDDGIQFNHRAFLDDNGNTRVKAVYLPNVSEANGGTKATIDGVELMGYQYTTPSQIAVLTCDDTNQSHGTHTTGCAAGSHVGDYAGMAPEADLILCGCGSSLTENAIVSSAKYIGWYAQQLGKPCVISISLGSDIGPHDGTSITSRAYTEVANTYGAVILLAAGNEADIIGHAKKTLTSDDDYIAVTNYVSGGWWGGSEDGACDIWNSTSDELQIKVIVNGSQSDWMTSGTFGDVTVSGGVNAFNNRYNLYIESSASSATYVVKGSAGNTINVYADCSYSTLSSNSGTVSGYTITPGTYEGSMCDDMTSPKVISVGAQASRATDGYGQGDVAYFSSYGVDCNGVNQPFITAPGHYVISSVNGYNTYQSVTWSMTYNGQTYNWGEKSGTSMATPCAAGVVAMYLQADPTLDVDRVKEVITQTATAYPLSSTSPVMARGHGIINALDGIEYILQHQGPTIIAKPDAVTIEGYQGETYTQVVKVKGYNLTGPITITKSGDAAYSVSHTTISAEDAYTGVDVTITYAPTAAGETTASLTLTSAEAETQIVTITGVAQPRVPTILVNPETLSFNAKLSTPATRTVKVNGLFLTNDITITLNDQNNVFTVSPTTISKDNTGIDTPVAVNVTFISDVEGDYTGSLTLTSNGAVTKTVQLTAKATDKGMASDPYLDLAKYETIDEVGATVSGMSTIYKYTEYAVDECAWLTLSCYGALKADDTQNWYNTNSLSQYNNEWNATDVFLGDAAYFGSNNAYSIYGSGSQSFYVTGCIQVKAYVKSGSYSSSNATLSIYECSLNADGTLNPATTATSTQQGSNGVITSAELDASKIYKVQLAGGGSYPDLLEIGFKAELYGPGPVATAATDITASSFVANWNALAEADSYTLRVLPKNYDILTETFSRFTKNGVQEIGSLLDNYMDNAGWTGSKVYEAIGGARLGTGSSIGALTSPGLDLTTSGGKVTVQFKAKAYNTDTNCGIKVSCGNASQTVTVPDNNEETFNVVLDCNAAAGQNIKFETTANGKRVILTSIHIMDGEHTKALRYLDLDGITIPGITTNSYKVIYLDPATIYFYDVKAVIGGKETKWSNKIMVTTLSGGIIGDVNGDGEVTTVDITCLYNYLLNGDETYLATSDVDGDGFITTTDITVIYNILLGTK